VAGGGDWRWRRQRLEEVAGACTKHYSGTLDVVCELQDGTKVAVEMQVVPQSLWERRSLVYATGVYSNQLREGAKWEEVYH
jgi:hypothetical protein